jgi:hypothetical protein
MELDGTDDTSTHAPPLWLSQSEFDEELIAHIAPAFEYLQSQGAFAEALQEAGAAAASGASDGDSGLEAAPSLAQVGNENSDDNCMGGGEGTSGDDEGALITDARHQPLNALSGCAELWRQQPALVVLQLHAHFSEAQLDRVARDYMYSAPHHAAGVHAARILSLRQQQQQQQQKQQLLRTQPPHQISSTAASSVETPPAVPAATVVARNRRYQRLQQLRAEGIYFSEAEIKERHPGLHYELLGRLLGEPPPEALPADQASDSILLGTALAEASRALAGHPRAHGTLPLPLPALASGRATTAPAATQALSGLRGMEDDEEGGSGGRLASSRGSRGGARGAAAACAGGLLAAVEAARAELLQAAGDLFLGGWDGAWVRYADEVDDNDALDDTKAQERADEDAYFDY